MIMKGLLETFLVEADDLIELLDAGLLDLERDPDSKETIDEVFRAAHTLKGSSGLFDLTHLTRLTHAAEDLLDAVRGGGLALTPEMIDDLLAVCDLVRGWLEVVRQTEALPADAATTGGALAGRLRVPLGGERIVRAGRRPASDSADQDGYHAAPAPAWILDELGVDGVEEIRAWLIHAQTRCRVVRFAPAEQCFFAGDDPLHLVAQTPAIEALSIKPREAWPAMDDFDDLDQRADAAEPA